MNRKTVKLIAVLLLLLLPVSGAFAAQTDYTGKTLEILKVSGVNHADSVAIQDLVYSYRGKEYTDKSFMELYEKLYDFDGVLWVEANDSVIPETGNLCVDFVIHEKPAIGTIGFTGNKILTSEELAQAVVSVSAGMFYDSSKDSAVLKAAEDIIALYADDGYSGTGVEYELTFDEERNEYDILFAISEVRQKRVVEIAFEGNTVKDKTLSSLVGTKKKTLFNSGALNTSQIESDTANIQAYYQTLGYIDASVTVRFEDVPPKKEKEYDQVRLIFTIVEGKQWTFGGIEISGNTVYSTEELLSQMSINKGDVANLDTVSASLTGLTDIYYNNGYVMMYPLLNETRDEQNCIISYSLNIIENEKSRIDSISFSGLTKTRENVFRRELAIKEGDYFSKQELINSYQNLYNTGLLETVDYKLSGADNGQDVNLEFVLTEGKQMDIQFGATFGGNSSGFPVSAFLSFDNKNLFGTARTLSLSTNLSPDTQSLSLSFGDDWFKDYRWANAVSLSFARTVNKNQMQAGIGSLRYGNNSTTDVYPLGYSSAQEYALANYATPASQYLMDYDLYTIGLGYNTGYTFVFDPGRLGVSGGLTIDVNRAVYDKNRFNPYDEAVYLYGQNFEFSNKFTTKLQWDGRDLIYYTTRGYVISQTFTYAGGILGGLSNYIKSESYGAAYATLFKTTGKDDVERNCTLEIASTLSLMLPQWSAKTGEWQPAAQGASTYEMLYIDGRTTARGFSDGVYNLSLMWNNSAEISYPIVRNVLDAQLFVTATGVQKNLTFNDLGWYFAAGAGLKLKISGFPLGIYLVKNATANVPSGSGFNWVDGNLLGGTKVVFAITSSLI